MNEKYTLHPDHELPPGMPEEKKLPAASSKLSLPPGKKYTGREPTKEEKMDIRENRTYAILSYFYPLSIVILATKYKSKFARFHAKQGMVLFLLSIIFLITPPLVKIIAELAVFAGMLAGIMQAAAGYYFKIPFVYDMTLPKATGDDIPTGGMNFKELFQDIWTNLKQNKSQLDKAREKELNNK